MEMGRDVAVIKVMVVVDEPELTQLTMKLAQAVDMDSGGPVGWEGTGNHGAVFEGRGEAMNGRCLGFGFVRAWWGEIT